MTERTCVWCGVPYTPRTNGGKPQRFCSEKCRVEFHRGCRLWAEQLVWSGELPVSALKNTLEQRIRSSERRVPQEQAGAGEANRASYAPQANHGTGRRFKEEFR